MGLFTNPLRLMLFVAVFLSFIFNMYAVPLFDVDEGAFAEATREMFARGDFISTYLNGVPRYDKPILIYWLQAASVAVFGFNEFGFRLPSALAAIAWVALTVLFVRRFSDERTGYVAGIIVATAFSISIIGKTATADALLNLLIAASLFGIYLYYDERRMRYVYGVFILMGLGFLTKGPVALLVPVAVSFIFFAIKREWRAWFRAAFNPIGILLFLAIALPWYVAQYAKEGQAFIDGFFLKHNVSRFQGPMEGHAGSLLYYIPVVLIGVLPFTGLLFKTLTKFRTMARDDLQLFLLTWFLFVLVFFSLSGTKLPHYVNYGLTAILILMAMHLGALRSSFWGLLPALAFFVTLLFLPEIIEAALAAVKDPFYHESLRHYRDYFSLGYRLFFVIAIAVTVFFMFDKRQPVQTKLLASGLMMVFAVSAFLLPTLGNMLQRPVKDAGLVAKGKDYDVVQWRIHMPSFSVYRQQVTPRRRPEPGDVVLTTPAYLKELGDYELLYVENGIVLVKLKG